MKATTITVLLCVLAPVTLGKFTCIKPNGEWRNLGNFKLLDQARACVAANDDEEVRNFMEFLEGGGQLHIKHDKESNWKVLLDIVHIVSLEGHKIQFEYGTILVVETSENLEVFREAARDLHNKIRSNHGVDNTLVLNSELNNEAQCYANMLACNGEQKSLSGGQREYEICPFEDSSKPDGAVAAKRIRLWYEDGKKAFKFDVQDLSVNDEELCHGFVAILWKLTTQVGFGLAYSHMSVGESYENVLIIVAMYEQGRKWSHASLKENVPQEISFLKRLLK